jgi:hypothetical protein
MMKPNYRPCFDCFTKYVTIYKTLYEASTSSFRSMLISATSSMAIFVQWRCSVSSMVADLDKWPNLC